MYIYIYYIIYFCDFLWILAQLFWNFWTYCLLESISLISIISIISLIAIIAIIAITINTDQQVLKGPLEIISLLCPCDERWYDWIADTFVWSVVLYRKDVILLAATHSKCTQTQCLEKRRLYRDWVHKNLFIYVHILYSWSTKETFGGERYSSNVSLGFHFLRDGKCRAVLQTSRSVQHVHRYCLLEPQNVQAQTYYQNAPSFLDRPDLRVKGRFINCFKILKPLIVWAGNHCCPHKSQGVSPAVESVTRNPCRFYPSNNESCAPAGILVFADNMTNITFNDCGFNYSHSDVGSE